MLQPLGTILVPFDQRAAIILHARASGGHGDGLLRNTVQREGNLPWLVCAGRRDVHRVGHEADRQLLSGVVSAEQRAVCASLRIANRPPGFGKSLPQRLIIRLRELRVIELAGFNRIRAWSRGRTWQRQRLGRQGLVQRDDC